MFYSIMKKLHVSAYIGHHQVFLPIKGVYISEYILLRYIDPLIGKKPDDGRCRPKHVVFS